MSRGPSYEDSLMNSELQARRATSVISDGQDLGSVHAQS